MSKDTEKRAPIVPRGDGSKTPEDAIGRALKRVYGAMVDEPLPDRFQKLLKDLEQSGSKK